MILELLVVALVFLGVLSPFLVLVYRVRRTVAAEDDAFDLANAGVDISDRAAGSLEQVVVEHIRTSIVDDSPAVVTVRGYADRFVQFAVEDPGRLLTEIHSAEGARVKQYRFEHLDGAVDHLTAALRELGAASAADVTAEQMG